ncbi:MAG: hypothetical protein DRO99_02425 [Candidatus Aenigmatarchaeota archaeon]|nr:MAG: hypothetical protein DRO99_02425 [Candidatus Aenigmarchaeota archaeon]
MDAAEKENALKLLDEKLNHYLDEKLEAGEIREELYKQAKGNVMRNLKAWISDDFIARNSPGLLQGLMNAIRQERWEDIIYAYANEISFGTGGIRGLACFNKEEVGKLSEEGLDAPILRGPNTINDIVLLLKSAGLAKYASENGLKSIVIGYDSRIRGRDFAELITSLFLAYGIKVYLFDESCPYPELTFAIPTIGADLGVLISASHNDKRYNGYKISSRTGAQIDVVQRNMIYNEYISKMSTSDIMLKPISEAKEGLTFVGGSERLPGKDYMGRDLIDMHTKHIDHMKGFIIDKPMFSEWAGKLNVGYCAFYGAGYKSVPRILREMGVRDLKIVAEMNRLDGTFPCFHLYQQPDPGDPVAESVAVEAFKEEHGEDAFRQLDVMYATDPDADRVGFVVKVPEAQREAYRKMSKPVPGLDKALKETLDNYKEREDHDWYLLTADEAFSLLLWYRLERMKELNGGRVPDAEKSFIVINHTTTDMLTKIAQKYGVGTVKAWVGFTFISGCVEKIWNGEKLDPEKDHDFMLETIGMDGDRSINIGAFEQSNGFTILGGKPLPGKYLGQNGHTRDKDGILACALFTELVAYAKSKGKSIIELLDEKVYLDPGIGFFANHVEASPYWGQYEGPTGLSKKIGVLKRLDKIIEEFNAGKELVLAGRKVLSVERYATGKYDALHNWKGFPDEGIRFFFDEDRLSYMTVRPSGTSHCIRFHSQIHKDVNRENLLEKKVEAYQEAKDVIAAIRELCGAG